MNGKLAIVGHTAQKSGEIFDLGYVACIDTFCHGGGWLTAMEVDSGRLWHVDRNGRPRKNDLAAHLRFLKCFVSKSLSVRKSPFF